MSKSVERRLKSQLGVYELEAENQQLREALEVAADRFENPMFHVEWQDAADACREALRKGE